MDYRAGLGGKKRYSGGGEVIGSVIGSKLSAAFVLGLSVLLAACSTQQSVATPPDPESILEALPKADPAQYDRIQNMKQWRNPYLIVRADGIVLYDSIDSAEIILKPKEVIPQLAKLPASNWPYGRVVAAAETTKQVSEQEGVAIRRNRGIIGGLLEGAHVAIKWVPET
jgi:hypothetical protein